MAGFGTAVNRPLYGSGPSAGLRCTIYAILSISLMYLDQRGGWTDRIHYYLQSAAYPVQAAVNSPSTLWSWLTDSLRTRASLRSENASLHQRQRELELASLRLQALERENAELRTLKGSLPALVKKYQLAEVVNVETNRLRQRLVINKGAHDGVFKNQAVVDATGILGQVASVSAQSAEVILITDPEHGIPVQVARNNLRTVAIGGGAADEIVLQYLASNADVKAGDQLVSSGLGGVFPAGYPVATVTGVSRGANQLTATVVAHTTGHPDRAREVMLIEFDPANPASPAAPATPASATTPANATRPAGLTNASVKP